MQKLLLLSAIASLFSIGAARAMANAATLDTDTSLAALPGAVQDSLEANDLDGIDFTD